MKTGWPALLGGLIFLAGCGGNDGDTPDLGTVEGTVTMDGAPLQGATVTVIPAGLPPSRGTTDAEGHYELKYKFNKPGAVVGTHPIRVDMPMVEPEGAAELSSEAYDRAKRELQRKNPIPKKYRDGSLTIVVEPGSNTFDIAIESEAAPGT